MLIQLSELCKSFQFVQYSRRINEKRKKRTTVKVVRILKILKLTNKPNSSGPSSALTTTRTDLYVVMHQENCPLANYVFNRVHTIAAAYTSQRLYY